MILHNSSTSTWTVDDVGANLSWVVIDLQSWSCNILSNIFKKRFPCRLYEGVRGTWWSQFNTRRLKGTQGSFLAQLMVPFEITVLPPLRVWDFVRKRSRQHKKHFFVSAQTSLLCEVSDRRRRTERRFREVSVHTFRWFPICQTLDKLKAVC